jgi:hypothetical protein
VTRQALDDYLRINDNWSRIHAVRGSVECRSTLPVTPGNVFLAQRDAG